MESPTTFYLWLVVSIQNLMSILNPFCVYYWSVLVYFRCCWFCCCCFCYVSVIYMNAKITFSRLIHKTMLFNSKTILSFSWLCTVSSCFLFALVRRILKFNTFKILNALVLQKKKIYYHHLSRNL